MYLSYPSCCRLIASPTKPSPLHIAACPYLTSQRIIAVYPWVRRQCFLAVSGCLPPWRIGSADTHCIKRRLPLELFRIPPKSELFESPSLRSSSCTRALAHPTLIIRSVLPACSLLLRTLHLIDIENVQFVVASLSCHLHGSSWTPLFHYSWFLPASMCVLYALHTQDCASGTHLPYWSTFGQDRYLRDMEPSGIAEDISGFVDVDVIDARPEYSSRTLPARGAVSHGTANSMHRRRGSMRGRGRCGGIGNKSQHSGTQRLQKASQKRAEITRGCEC